MDCNFQQVSAEELREQYIRDAFVRGLRSDLIRQRLLESRDLNFETAFDKTRTFETASEHLKSYAYTKTKQSTSNVTAAISKTCLNTISAKSSTAKSIELKCFFGSTINTTELCVLLEKRFVFIAKKLGTLQKYVIKRKLRLLLTTLQQK